MKRINNILKELDVKPVKYERKGNVVIVTTKDLKLAIKKLIKKYMII